ncbi:MAG TPA: hypothetical protein GX521_06245, partial [Firmicutes bacterium]|nr:hypothetical protein [Bacillota bacterium]
AIASGQEQYLMHNGVQNEEANPGNPGSAADPGSSVFSGASCPDCGGTMVEESGCSTCLDCGFSRCS